jgi:hypothetical protein
MGGMAVFNGENDETNPLKTFNFRLKMMAFFRNGNFQWGK